MEIRPNLITLSVADYCNAFNRREVLVDRKYQRNAGVWPVRAQSYLIETILCGFPIPKLALHQQTDLKSRKSLKYVVDGQQRTNAIVDFFDGKLTLSQSLELEDARGKRLDGLSQELQKAFLSYPLLFDQFEATDEDVVREYFRRINSFTTPLNPEERRHANFQGNMKWFILKLSERHTESLLSLGTLSEREVVRMGDHKLFAEVVHAMLNGIHTTNSRMLDTMYREYNSADIPEEERLLNVIDAAFDRIAEWTELGSTDVVQKSYILYSLILAIMAMEHRWETLQQPDVMEAAAIVWNAEQRLLEMSDAIFGEGEASLFDAFLKASKEKTNTKLQRQTRVRWLATAISRTEW